MLINIESRDIIDMNSLLFCAMECGNQRSGEMSVYNMAQALIHARENYKLGYFSLALQLGEIVEPSVNADGFRRYPVMVNGNRIKWETIGDSMKALCTAADHGNLTPDEFFLEFQLIHPFGDGNGRTGAILWNRINNSLYSPVIPPNPFSKG